MKILEKIILAIECFCRKLYSKVWYYRIVFTTNLTRKTNVRRSSKEEIKLCEGYVNKILQMLRGFDTIFYGHKITPDDEYEHGIEYTKQEGELVFERDFQRTLEAAERLIGDRPINNTAKEVIINMVYQIGEGGVYQI